MSNIRQAAPLTMAQIYQELKDMGFGDDDQDINGGDFVEYGGQLYEDLRLAIPKENAYLTRYLAALRATRDSLANWMEVQSPEDARDYDTDALRLADEVLAGAPLPAPCMAGRWVALMTEWQDSDLTSTYDFSTWLEKTHPNDADAITWIASWDARPVDGQLQADPLRATSFSVMDFSDGSMAIKRNFDDSGYNAHAQWKVVQAAP